MEHSASLLSSKIQAPNKLNLKISHLYYTLEQLIESKSLILSDVHLDYQDDSNKSSNYG
jgi:hypothetical protein